MLVLAVVLVAVIAIVVRVRMHVMTRQRLRREDAEPAFDRGFALAAAAY
jgi:hypothetical protein